MDDHKNTPGKNMRILLAGGKISPLARLPKKANVSSFLSSKADKKDGTPTESSDAPSLKGISLKKKMKKETVQAPPKLVLPASKSMRLNFWPPFWTIASVLSMVVNIALFIALLVLLPNVQKVDVNNMLGLSGKLLGDLYTNFEKMD